MLPATMTPPWALYAGDPSSITVTLTEDGAPLVLAGDGWEAQWRTSAGAAESVLIDVDTSGAAAAGRLVLRLTGEQTRLMRQGGVWDLQQTVGGVTRTYVRGTTTWTQDVTR